MLVCARSVTLYFDSSRVKIVRRAAAESLQDLSHDALVHIMQKTRSGATLLNVMPLCRSLKEATEDDASWKAVVHALGKALKKEKQLQCAAMTCRQFACWKLAVRAIRAEQAARIHNYKGSTILDALGWQGWRDLASDMFTVAMEHGRSWPGDYPETHPIAQHMTCTTFDSMRWHKAHRGLSRLELDLSEAAWFELITCAAAELREASY